MKKDFKKWHNKKALIGDIMSVNFESLKKKFKALLP